MKRYFPLLIGLCLLLAGLTVRDTFADLSYDTLTVYDGGETVYEADERPPSTRGKYVRADLEGDAADVLKALGARELAREEIDGMTVIYAFSPRISAYETLRYGRVNVMIAVRGARLVVGSPLIKGSY